MSIILDKKMEKRQILPEEVEKLFPKEVREQHKNIVPIIEVTKDTANGEQYFDAFEDRIKN